MIKENVMYENKTILLKFYKKIKNRTFTVMPNLCLKILNINNLERTTINMFAIEKESNRCTIILTLKYPSKKNTFFQN